MNNALGQRTLDFIESLEALEKPEQIIFGFRDMVRDFGFEFFLITGLPDPGGKFEDEIMLNAWPQGWFDRYIENGYIDQDPVAFQCSVNTQPFAWHDVEVDSRRWPIGPRIMGEATEFSMYDGLCVPIFGLNGFQSVVTLAGDDLDLSSQTRASIHLASIYAHGRARALLEGGSRPGSEKTILSGRERECLKWAAAGKSSWEISRILGLSENTVTGYFKAAALKLGCVNRTQAVAEAIRTGQIRI